MSKKSIKDNLIISILIILMILIMAVTIYFILDVFGIINVPARYSIASLFYSQIEVIATGGEILTEDNSKFHEKDDIALIQNQITNNDNIEDNNPEIDYSGMQKPLDQSEKDKLQNQVNENNNNNNNNNVVEFDNFYYNQLEK